jgi:hypothetical protein
MLNEGRSLTAVLSSNAVTLAVRPLQARGEHNPCDFDKYVFQLPIPLYNGADPDHLALVALAERAEQVAASVELTAVRFEALRRRVREPSSRTALLASSTTGSPTYSPRSRSRESGEETRADPTAPEPPEVTWFTPGVGGIGTASLLADVGHELPTSLLPSLLTSTLGAPASALGAIEGLSDALAGAARFAGGALADDPHRRRNVAVGGYATKAVLSAGIGAATAVWQVALLRAGAWTARGLRVPARNALLADVVPAAAYGRA